MIKTKKQQTLRTDTNHIQLKHYLWRSVGTSSTSSSTNIDWPSTCSTQQTSRLSSATNLLQKLSMIKQSLLSLPSRTNTFLHVFSYHQMDVVSLISQSKSLQDMVSCFLRKVVPTRAALLLTRSLLMKDTAEHHPKREGIRLLAKQKISGRTKWRKLRTLVTTLRSIPKKFNKALLEQVTITLKLKKIYKIWGNEKEESLSLVKMLYLLIIVK